MAKQRNQWLNIVQAIASILVVFIHFPFQGVFGSAVSGMATISVPLFFSISGYYFYKEDCEKEYVSILSKIKHLLWLLLLSEGLYFSWYLFLQCLHYGLSFIALWNVINAEIIGPGFAQLVYSCLIFEPPFNNVNWFMGSLIAVYASMRIVVKRRWQDKAIVIASFLICIGFILRRIQTRLSISLFFDVERIFPFLPFPFFMLGYGIRKHQDIFININLTFYYLLLFFGVILAVIEPFFGTHRIYIGTLCAVLSLICLICKHCNYIAHSAVSRLLSYIGGNLSTFIYIFHMLVGTLVSTASSKVLGLSENSPFVLNLLPPAIVVITVVFSFFIHRISQWLHSLGSVLWKLSA